MLESNNGGIMNCPKCNEEIEKDSLFCPSCGEKLTNEDSKKCPKCGVSNKNDASFCNGCGYNFSTSKEIVLHETTRTAELILGIIASILGFFVSFIALFFSAFAESAAMIFLCLIFFSILGLVSTLIVKKYHDLGGIGMLLSGICLLFTGGTLGIISSILFIVGDLLAIFRK